MTWRTAFLAGLLVVGILIVVGQTRSVFRYQNPAYLLGRYHESRQAFLASYLNREDHGTLERYATENKRWFDELRQKRFIIPVTVPGSDDPHYDEFLRATSGLMFIRPGWALVGGQWPIGIEYVNALDRWNIPVRFIKPEAQ